MQGLLVNVTIIVPRQRYLSIYLSIWINMILIVSYRKRERGGSIIHRLIVVTMYLVFKEYIYGSIEDTFLRFNIFLPYGHICPTLEHEPLTQGPVILQFWFQWHNYAFSFFLTYGEVKKKFFFDNLLFYIFGQPLAHWGW